MAVCQRSRWGPVRPLAAILLALTLSLTGSRVASAHALLLRATPTPSALLKAAPSAVHLLFSEDLNGGASRIVVWDRYRHNETEGPATLVPGQPRQLQVGLKPLPPGSYLVLWTSVSAEDGHILHGAYSFSVKVRGPGPSLVGVSLGNGPQTFPDTIGLLSIMAHWVELTAAITWLGAAVFSALIFVPVVRNEAMASALGERSLLRLLLEITLACLIVASAVVFLLQLYALAGDNWSSTLTGTTLSSAFAAQYGRLWIVRQAVVLATLAAVLLSLRRAAPRGQAEPRNHAPSPGLLLSLVAGCVYLYLLAASGHAASVNIGTLLGSNVVSGSVFFDWLHFAGVGLWLGGQTYIVCVLIPALGLMRGKSCDPTPFMETLNRFSPFAYAGITLAGLSGVFNSKVHIPSWYAFFNSVYGRALIIKLGLIGLMMLLSMWTVYGIRPRIRRALAAKEDGSATRLVRSLVRWLHVNPVLGAGVLLATSVMFAYPVPAGFAPTGPSSYTVSASGVTATVTLRPDRSGPNVATVLLHDAAGHPVRQAHVSVLTTMLDMVMGTQIFTLAEKAPGTYGGTVDLGMGGHWRLELLIYRPQGLARAHFTAQVAT